MIIQKRDVTVMPSPFSRLSDRNRTSSPSPIAHPKPTASSILKQPMRNATSYLTALQADDDARRKSATAVNGSEPAFSLHSSLRTDDSTSYFTTDDSNSEESYDDLDRPPHPPTSEQKFHTRHSEFGHCLNEAYRRTSAYVPGTVIMPHVEEDPPYYILLTTYLSYLLMIIFGHLRDFVGKRFVPDAYRHLMPSDVSHSMRRA